MFLRNYCGVRLGCTGPKALSTSTLTFLGPWVSEIPLGDPP